MQLPEDFEGQYLYRLPELADDVRSAMISHLDAHWRNTPQIYDREMSQMPVEFMPDPEAAPDPPSALPCRLVRLLLCPPPNSLGGGDHFASMVHGDAALQHIVQCESCAAWDCVGRPFQYDMAWHIDRQLFCRTLQEVIIHGNEWPLSYIAACQHAEYCPECTPWVAAFHNSQSCQEVRRYIHRLDTRHVLFRDYPKPHILYDDHIAHCFRCKAWAFTEVTCEEVREHVQHIYNSNEAEWKTYRHDTIGPVVTAHFELCPNCREWGSDHELFRNRMNGIEIPRNGLDPDSFLFLGDNQVDA